MKLLSYWRSTTSYRVRIVLNLKGVAYEQVPVDLVAGVQSSPEYTAINPVQGVPALELDDGTILTQSMAILEWLEATYPDPALIPSDPIAAAHMRAAANVIACDIHPVNNLKVGKELKALGHTQDDLVAWMKLWMQRGFDAYQALIRPDTPYSFGSTPDLADICLTAQMYNAHRWGLDLGPYARLIEIEQRCLALPAVDAARPENQPDAS